MLISLLQFLLFHSISATDCDIYHNVYLAVTGIDDEGIKSTCCTITNPYGVQCNNQDRITDIFLNGFSYEFASIHPTIGDLIFLKTIDLSYNRLTGTIPTSFSQLSNLESLTLTGNFLIGNISPIKDLTSLINLTLSYNAFSGPITKFTTNLEIIELTFNNFTGNLPDTFETLTKLKKINLNRNEFTGEIPVSLKNLVNSITTPVQEIDVSNNFFTGEFQYSGPNYCYAATNQLCAPDFDSCGISKCNADCFIATEVYFAALGVPKPFRSDFYNDCCLFSFTFGCSEISRRVTSLDFSLMINENTTISNSITLLQSLQSFSLFYFNEENLEITFPSPTIPDIWQNMTQLTSFSFIGFVQNAKQPTLGTIPNSFRYLTNLEKLVFSFAFSETYIPDFIGDLTKLRILRLNGNNVTGDIPDIFSNFHALENLDLSFNRLSSSLSSIQNLVNLTTLNLSFNRFTGLIPSFIGDFTSLTELSLDYNEFIGLVPKSIQDLPNLSYISVKNNQLVGKINIISSSLSYCDAQSNNLCSSPSGASCFIPTCNAQLQTYCEVYFALKGLPCPENDPILSNGCNDSKYGITCNVDGSITDIVLTDDLELTGTLSSSIQFLTSLRKIDLSNNNLQGPIPDVFQNLGFLEILLLQNNSFQGSIPNSIVTVPLTKIDLSRNQLSGVIPDGFNLIPTLNDINFANNNLIGPLPTDLFTEPKFKTLDAHNNQIDGKLPELTGTNSVTSLDLSSNLISGTIPNSFANFQSLIQLKLSGNLLEGDVPTDFYGLTTLETLELQDNRLTGDTSQIIQLSSLVDLNLSNNLFTGSLPNLTGSTIKKILLNKNKYVGNIPASFATLDSLEVINLAELKLEGDLTTFFGNLQSIQSIDLHGNNFKGTLSNLSQLENLISLDLHDNLFTGNIPSAIGSNDIQTIDLSSNQLTGIIPSSLSNKNSLRYLDLSNNKLTGTIPSNLGGTALNLLDLSSNTLIGPIPNSISQLSNLTFLDLSDNNLSGTIPDLSLLDRLEALILSKNSLTGEYPSYFNTKLIKLKLLWLDFNLFFGVLPNTFDSLTELESLILSGNKFSGQLPTTFGLAFQLNTLWLDLNDFEGMISDSVFSNVTLESLFLSSNNFYGPIPNVLSTMDSLKSLRMDNNKFNGTIPIEFENLTNLKDLYLHSNNLVGEFSGANILNCDLSFNDPKVCDPTTPPACNIPSCDDCGSLCLVHESLTKSTCNPSDFNQCCSQPNQNWFKCDVDVTNRRISEISVNGGNLIDFDGSVKPITTGSISPAIGFLTNLKLIDLSNNGLIGPIPLSIQFLRELESINLSRNSIDGSIPQQFTELTQLKTLYVF
ncbi:hypothetical protein BC833DRAFT_298443 [Globomyces pollinis-pini]|nr:hypothetical protein BC833DRAFT_298443 [Globomyces pollinis-pini]